MSDAAQYTATIAAFETGPFAPAIGFGVGIVVNNGLERIGW